MENRAHGYTKFPCFTICKKDHSLGAFSGTGCAAVRVGYGPFLGSKQAPPALVRLKIAVPIRVSGWEESEAAAKEIGPRIFVPAVGEIPGVAAMGMVAGNGYINIRFDRGAYGSFNCWAEETKTAARLARGKEPSSNTRTSTPQARAYRPSAQTPCWRHGSSDARRRRGPQSRRSAKIT